MAWGGADVEQIGLGVGDGQDGGSQLYDWVVGGGPNPPGSLKKNYDDIPVRVQ